jgi:hypothetical protein
LGFAPVLRKFLIILLLALTAAKVAAVLARGPVSIERDAWGYWRLSALAMVGDAWMLGEPIAYRTPAYPWFLALVRSCSGSSALFVIAILQSILNIASLWIAGRIAVRITRLPGALPWTLLVSLPAVSALTFNAAVLSETLFVFVLMVHLLAVMDYAKYGTAGRAIWLGVTFAAALLTRPIVLLLWAAHGVFVLYIHVRKRRRLGKNSPGRVTLSGRCAHAGLAVAAAAALVSPWLIRNQVLFGEPFLTEFVGRNLWVVTFQGGSGTGLELPDSAAAEVLMRRLANVSASHLWQETWAVSVALVASGLNDAQADQLMRRVALDAIEQHPQPFAMQAFRRVVNFWRCAATELPEQGQRQGKFLGQQTWRYRLPVIDWVVDHRGSQSVTLNTLLAACLGVAIVVLVFNFPSRPYAVWLALIFAYFAGVTGILEIPAYRYRMIVEPLVALVIGAAIAVALSRRRRPATVAAAP